MSAPTSPDDAAVGPPEHLHPLFLLTGLGGSLRGIAGGYVAIGYLAVSGRWGTAFFGMLALVAIMTIGIFLTGGGSNIASGRTKSASTVAS